MNVKKVMVVGSGLMGAGITQVIAAAGISVLMVDQRIELAERGLAKIAGHLKKLVGSGQLGADELAKTLEAISISEDSREGEDVDLVIEAIPERLDWKRKVFSELDSVVKRDAIFATNTSSLSIASIATATERPERVIGLHFFSPVPVMKLLEIIPSLVTSEETITIAQSFGQKIGKETIVAADYPGFTVNRLLVPMMNEAAYLVMEGNRPEAIDKGMRLGANHPCGPLQLADSIGLDVLLDTLHSLNDGFHDSKYRPCPLLSRMVEAGKLGKKSGFGFYNYP